MRIGFAGTPVFAATALESILAAGLSVGLVLTQPDRPHGRGMRREPGPVKALAIARGIPARQPQSLKPEAELAAIMSTSVDVLVVAAYGLILPKAILDWPRHCCINIHASLLPRWRGAAPIERALLAGDRDTGVTIMRMDEGLDTGPVIVRHPVPIDARETAGSLRDKLAALGARAIVDVLLQLQRGGRLDAPPQLDVGATYAAKIGRDEANIDWRAGAQALDRAVRAFDPAPGAQTTLDGQALKIWRALPLAGRFGAPGSVVRTDPAGIIVACGEGALVVTELQRAGGRRMSVGAFLAGHPLATDVRLGSFDGANS
jgi:methionyl-tRNA formyltransferase